VGRSGILSMRLVLTAQLVRHWMQLVMHVDAQLEKLGML